MAISLYNSADLPAALSFFFQAEDGIRDLDVTGVQTCALPISSEVKALAAGVRGLLGARQSGIAEQLAELRALRGKNQDVVEHMMDRVRQEKELFERGLQRFTALRTVFSQQI